jgi:hypothetical protein
LHALPSLLIAVSTFAHLGRPSEAIIATPEANCQTADQSFAIHWMDFDKPIPTGTATVDLFYIQEDGPTFNRGDKPDWFVGESTPIVRGILERDLTDAWTWKTSTIAPGIYWIWSYVNNPPTEFGTISYVDFSPYPIAIQHTGDPTLPSITLTTPDSPYRFTDDHYSVKYESCDPTGTGKVRLEWTETEDRTGFELLVDDLPASAMGTYEWDTLCLPEGSLTLKATITDARGMSNTSYAKYYLLVTHLLPPDGGCGVSLDGGTVGSDAQIIVDDAGPSGRDGSIADGGTAKGKGCACTSASDSTSGLRGLVLLGLLALFAAGCAGTKAPMSQGSAIPSTSAPEPTPPPAARNKPIADTIIHAALTSSGAYDKLEHLTDRIGNRLSGSHALEEAIRWAEQTMKAERVENVHAEPVQVPHWVRGEEHGELVRPFSRKLHLLALGGSIGTPAGGITAPIVVVRTYDELEKLGDRVKGKIVVFDNPMPPYGPEGAHYGETVVFRSSGAARAAKLGAIGVLIRSVTARSLRSPHTGATRYDPGVRPIPAAALSTEDAAMLARLWRSSADVAVKIELGAKMLADVESANVVGEVVGTTLPDEAVILGAHLDSWDVGQGAHDDGAGCTTLMEALALLERLHLHPKRTIRAVLFTNEENGLRGAQAYAKAHANDKLVAAIEMDSGGFKPVGFDLEPTKTTTASSVLAVIKPLGALLESIGASRVALGHSGADVGALKDRPVPLLGLVVDGSRYFDYHHSEADTFDKVDAKDLARDVAAMAVMAYALADQ